MVLPAHTRLLLPLLDVLTSLHHRSYYTRRGEEFLFEIFILLNICKYQLRQIQHTYEKGLEVGIKVDVIDEKEKTRAMRMASASEGVISISLDMEGQLMTVTGAIDPAMLVEKLRKRLYADLVYVGPLKQRELMLKVDWPNDEDMKKVVDAIFGYGGVDTVGINMKDKKLKVIGALYPSELIKRLKQKFSTGVISIELASGGLEEERQQEGRSGQEG